LGMRTVEALEVLEEGKNVEEYRRNRKQYGQARSRAMARRRRRRRRQRILLSAALFLMMLLTGGAVFGVIRYRDMKERQAFAIEGITAAKHGDYDSAIEAFNHALKNNKEKIGSFEVQVLLHRAEAEYKMGDYRMARDTYNLLREKDEENTVYKKGAALCMMEMGEYETALELGVLVPDIYNRMAKAEIETGQYDLALQNIESGLTAAVSDEEAGQEEEQEGRKADSTAVRELEYNRAVVMEYKGDFAEALRLLEEHMEKYGATENVEREIAFLRTRQQYDEVE